MAFFIKISRKIVHLVRCSTLWFGQTHDGNSREVSYKIAFRTTNFFSRHGLQTATVQDEPKNFAELFLGQEQ